MTQESIKIKAAIALGKQRFFERHPELLREADEVADLEAETLGAAALSERREVARYRVIAAYSRSLNKDSFAMLLELGSNSPEEFQQLIAAQNAEIKRSVGM